MQNSRGALIYNWCYGLFERIADQTAAFQVAKQSVIAVDAQKKELVGALKNGVREWQETQHPEGVKVRFPSSAECKATLYGARRLRETRDASTSVSIVIRPRSRSPVLIANGIRRVRNVTPRRTHHLYITADGGGVTDA